MYTLLSIAKAHHASDLHITVGVRPKCRISGTLYEMDGFERLTPAMTKELVESMFNEKQKKTMEATGEVDFAYTDTRVGRFRVNAFHQRGSYAAVLRIVASDIPTPEDLGVPEAVLGLTKKKRGLVLVTGPTGSGKSTLVNLIARFYDATSGTIQIDGQNIQNYSQHDLREKIGVVPQRAVLFKGSIRENMKWGRENATDEEIWDALTTAQAREIVENKNGQLDFKLEQNGRNLSGGQRQRLTIARAVVKKPEFLILDDSASALDFATDAALRRSLHQLSGNVTTFLVSQRAASIRQADLILVLDDGELVGKGIHDDLIRTCDTYREIYFSQFPEEREKYNTSNTAVSVNASEVTL